MKIEDDYARLVKGGVVMMSAILENISNDVLEEAIRRTAERLYNLGEATLLGDRHFVAVLDCLYACLGGDVVIARDPSTEKEMN